MYVRTYVAKHSLGLTVILPTHVCTHTMLHTFEPRREGDRPHTPDTARETAERTKAVRVHKECGQVRRRKGVGRGGFLHLWNQGVVDGKAR